MKVTLFPFQENAVEEIRAYVDDAVAAYRRHAKPQVISFTAPTGAGKTIIMANLIEDILFGDENYPEQQDAVFVWLSDSPQLNAQSKDKIQRKSDRIRYSQCITITEESFDQEVLDDGRIYFLNTQKLSKTSNLAKQGDQRQCTIWQTLENTAREKSDRLYFIIDEAHRGAQGRDAARATTIMQKFLKGSPEDGLDPMPVVIGMSATIKRFEKLAADIDSTRYSVRVDPEEVRESGLLKDWIILDHPADDSGDHDMTVLQAAAENWKEKCTHWSSYCRRNHEPEFNPIFVIQVQNGTEARISNTDLDEVLKKIEERLDYRFQKGEVVHTFGQKESSIPINGLSVPYVEPSRIQDEAMIRVVFFKESLSTGWDCPRAETMMSFQRAEDATYIAQLLGRMIRTPLQKRIQSDDVLNDVHLFLPHFNARTAQAVIESLQDSEGTEISSDISEESIEDPKYKVATYHSVPLKKASALPEKKKPDAHDPDQIELTENLDSSAAYVAHSESMTRLKKTSDGEEHTNYFQSGKSESEVWNCYERKSESEPDHKDYLHGEGSSKQSSAETTPSLRTETVKDESVETGFDREEIADFINRAGLSTYEVSSKRIRSYCSSLFVLASFLSYNLSTRSITMVKTEIVQKISDYIDGLKRDGTYQDRISAVLEFSLSSERFDIYGKSMDEFERFEYLAIASSDLDRHLDKIKKTIGEGVAEEYGRRHQDSSNPEIWKAEVILFAEDAECMRNLEAYAKEKFQILADSYRVEVAQKNSEILNEEYNRIIQNSSVVEAGLFRLSEEYKYKDETGGKEYRDHLFVNSETGTISIKLNSWEAGVIEEEEQRSDFVCWIRNEKRKNRANSVLCIPYDKNGQKQAMYPDFLIVRKDPDTERYLIDILEPHGPEFSDGLAKAKGMAEYAKKNPIVSRVQMIRRDKDGIFRRLDLARSSVQQAVSRAVTFDDLDNLFEVYSEK